MAAKSQRLYEIKHRTRFDYGGRIDLCHNEARLCPINSDYQSTKAFKIVVEPSSETVNERMDCFGNRIHFFSVEHSHDELAVTSESEVLVSTKQRPWEQEDFPDPAYENVLGFLENLSGSNVLEIGEFIYPSQAVPRHSDLREYALVSFTSNANLIAATRHLMNRIFTDFTYVSGATDISTPVLDVLEGRRGVCQDFAHLMISCLRSLGFAARYVSGYLETQPPPGQPKLQGADASHAWVELYVPEFGWLPFDPTNDVCPGANHIVLATGRDYFDVQPVRGIFVGVGQQLLSVEVDVIRR
ncbi:MAG: transglutaminase family protein [Verrucomicrobiota bacterium]